MGRTEPRLFTPPLRELTPDTSYGFDVIDFGAAIGWPLDPWEKWAVIHGGELLPDGTPRFRFLLILVARQNGKTTLCRVLILYWMFIERHTMILGTSTSRDTAKVSWRETIAMAEGTALLNDEMEALHTRETIGEESFFNIHGSHYRFAAPNRRAGRSFTIRRLILDELREHKTFDTYDAAVNAGNAVPDFQAVAITNQGDATSVVLDSIRTSALEFIETGQGDETLFIAEWSAPAGADPTDPEMLAYANPNLGNRIPLVALLGQARRAKAAGGEQLARFRTEVMCQRVTLLDPAIDPDGWRDSGNDEPPDLAEHRRRVALCFDVALDGSHVTAVVAAEIDGLVYPEVAKTWYGFGCTNAARAELPGLITQIKPRMVGWFPNGPAAVLAADISTRRGWPRGVKVEKLAAEAPAICMGLADLVDGGLIRHPRDEMLTSQVGQAQKLRRGDRWTFTRAGNSPIDAVYALGGAVHMARTMPKLAPLEVA